MTSSPNVVAPDARRLPRHFKVLLVLGVLALVAFIVAAVLVASNNSNKLQMQNAGADRLVTYSSGMQIAAATATLPRLGGGSPVTVGGDGRPMIINFFASWCPACQKELGAVAAVAHEHIVSFVGVDTDDTSASAAMSLLHKAHATYPVGTGNASLATRYNTSHLPTTAFVNGKGKLVAIYLGAITKPELTKWARELAAGEPLTK